MTNSVLFSLVTRVVIMLGGVVTSVITARVLGVEGRGEYFYVVTLANMAAQLANLGLASSNTFSLAKDNSLLSRLAANSLWISLVLGCLSATVIYFVESLAVSGEPDRGTVWLVLIMTPPMLYGMLASNLLIGLNKIHQYNYYLQGSTAVQLIAIFMAAQYAFDVQGFLVVSAVSGMLASFALFRMLSRFMAHTWSFDYNLLRSNVGYASRAYIITLIGFFVSRLAVIFLARLSGEKEVGLYSIALQFADVLVIVPSTVAMILFPNLLKGEKLDRYPQTLRAVRSTTAIMLALCLLTAFAVRWLIPLVFGQEFTPAIPILYWMLPGVLALSVANIMSQYLAADGIPPANIVAWAGSLAVLLIGCIQLIPRWEGLGAAMSVSMAYCLLAVLIIFIAFRRSKITCSPHQT